MLRAFSAETLLRVDWEEDCTLYNRNTGETHLLNPLPAEIITMLQSRPMSREELAAALAARCEVQETAEWRERVAEMVDQLLSISLLENVPG